MTKLAILEILHLYYLTMSPLPVGLPPSESVQLLVSQKKGVNEGGKKIRRREKEKERSMSCVMITMTDQISRKS